MDRVGIMQLGTARELARLSSFLTADLETECLRDCTLTTLLESSFVTYSCMSIFQVIYNSLVASNSLKAPKLLAEIRQPNSVMEDPVVTIVIGIGCSNDTN